MQKAMEFQDCIKGQVFESCNCAGILSTFSGANSRRKRGLPANAPAYVKTLATCVTSEYGRLGVTNKDVRAFRDAEREIKTCIFDHFAGPVLEMFVRQCINRVGIDGATINDVMSSLLKAGPGKTVTDSPLKNGVGVADAVLGLED